MTDVKDAKLANVTSRNVMYFPVLYTVYTAVYLIMKYTISKSQNCYSPSSATSIGV